MEVYKSPLAIRLHCLRFNCFAVRSSVHPPNDGPAVAVLYDGTLNSKFWTIVLTVGERIIFQSHEVAFSLVGF